MNMCFEKIFDMHHIERFFCRIIEDTELVLMVEFLARDVFNAE